MATPEQSPNPIPDLQRLDIETSAIEQAHQADALLGKIALRMWGLEVNIYEPSTFNLPQQDGWKRISFIPAYITYGDEQVRAPRIIVNECFTDDTNTERATTEDYFVSLERNEVLQVHSDTAYCGTLPSGEDGWIFPPHTGPLALLVNGELRLYQSKDYEATQITGKRFNKNDVEALTTLWHHVQPVTPSWQDEVTSYQSYVQ